MYLEVVYVGKPEELENIINVAPINFSKYSPIHSYAASLIYPCVLHFQYKTNLNILLFSLRSKGQFFFILSICF